MSFAEKNKNKSAESPYEILIRCLGKDDFAEWNGWRDNNEQTVFSGTGLSEARIEPRLIERVKKNIRRVWF